MGAAREVEKALRAVSQDRLPAVDDIVTLLSVNDPAARELIYDRADAVRRRWMGDGILLRGIIEFSNICDNTCFYCGLNRNNPSLVRYRLTREQIFQSARRIAACGIRTVILQSGQDPCLDPRWLAEVIAEIKSRLALAVTVSAGEQSTAAYRLWREAGADRYLLKIETTDRKLYESLHESRSLATRKRCLRQLQRLGYQTGSGNMIGLPHQTIPMIARDIVYFAREQFDMLGIGPFIPHDSTVLRSQPAGDFSLSLNALAVTRIVTRDTHLPATTALGSLPASSDGRLAGLKAGANVVMLNFTPRRFRGLYEIYPGKVSRQEGKNSCGYVSALARRLGRTIDTSRGDSLKQ